MALQDFFEPFTMIGVSDTSDGYGGNITSHTRLFEFKAGISTSKSKEDEIAYKDGIVARYIIVYDDLSIRLKQNDIVHRAKDGRLYRITSDSEDMETPNVAQVKYKQVTAEVITV